ncbi:MAG: hypothetical protein IH867_12030 [Chloroflexi bacterium]|nr:hypothetical protein [Chloroflexota bacterium]
MPDRDSDSTPATPTSATPVFTTPLSGTDVSRSAVRWRLASDVAQHPVTTLALGAFALSGIYLLVLTPVLGGAVIATATLGVSGAVTAVNFAYRYRKEYSTALRDLLDAQAREQVRLDGVGMRQRQRSLREGFDAVGHAEGVNALESLSDEYYRLQLSLNYRDEFDLISGSRVEGLADETYRRGISVLADALTLVEVIQTPGVEEIAGEITVLESEIRSLSDGDGQTGRLDIKKNVLASQRRRLAELNQLQVNVDELLYQSHRCEVSLHHARIELAAIKAGSRGSAVSSVIGALEGTIRRAKEVQEELKSLGF